MSVSARSPALSVICSLAGQRLDLPAQLLQPPQVVLLLPLARTCPARCSFSSSTATARSSRSAASGLASAVLAQHVGVAPQPAPARDQLLGESCSEATSCSSSAASVSSRPAAASPACAAARAPRTRGRRPGSAASATPRTRRNRRQRVPPHLQLGDPILGIGAVQLLDLPRTRAADRPARARPLRPPICFGGALALPLRDRLAHGLDRRLEALRRAPRRRRCRPAARPTRAARRPSAASASAGSASATSASASRSNWAARALTILGGHPRRPAPRRRRPAPLRSGAAATRARRARHLVARALGDGGHSPSVSTDALQRRDGHVGVLGLERDREQFLGVVQARRARAGASWPVAARDG